LPCASQKRQELAKPAAGAEDSGSSGDESDDSRRRSRKGHRGSKTASKKSKHKRSSKSKHSKKRRREDSKKPSKRSKAAAGDNTVEVVHGLAECICDVVAPADLSVETLLMQLHLQLCCGWKRRSLTTPTCRTLQGVIREGFGAHGILRETDMYAKRAEFQAWAIDVQKVDIEIM
jgi:hypothetical protein